MNGFGRLAIEVEKFPISYSLIRDSFSLLREEPYRRQFFPFLAYEHASLSTECSFCRQSRTQSQNNFPVEAAACC